MDKEEAQKIFNKYMNATKRQHYVKKEYLSGWSPDGKTIFGKRKNNPSLSSFSLNDVCVSNDIYSITHHYNDLELTILKSFYQNFPLYIKKEIDSLLSTVQFQTSKMFLNITENNETGKKLSKGFQSQTGEDYQTRTEQSFFEIIEKYIKKKDDSFLDSVSLRTTFAIGLATQYMRTNKMRELMRNGIKATINKFEIEQNVSCLDKLVDADALWQGTLLIMPYLMTYQLNQKRYGIQFICSKNMFFTSDNPVIHIGKKDENGCAVEMAFLYPVSPDLCIVYPSKTGIKKPNAIEISRINNLIIEESHNFVFQVRTNQTLKT